VSCSIFRQCFDMSPMSQGNLHTLCSSKQGSNGPATYIPHTTLIVAPPCLHLTGVSGSELPTSLVPVSSSTLGLISAMAVAGVATQTDLASVGTHSLVFPVDLPPLGYTTVTVRAHALDTRRATTPSEAVNLSHLPAHVTIKGCTGELCRVSTASDAGSVSSAAGSGPSRPQQATKVTRVTMGGSSRASGTATGATVVGGTASETAAASSAAAGVRNLLQVSNGQLELEMDLEQGRLTRLTGGQVSEGWGW
jgi:hypothetical protein